MFRALFLFLLLTPQFALAQPLPDRVPLAGFALDSAGKPLPNALISLRRQESSGAFAFWSGVTASDARGAWRFANAEAGRYFLSAEAPGFAPLSNQSVEWRAGLAPLRLSFERLVNLKLQILGSDAKPLANAPLWVRLRGDGNVGQVTRRAVTDDAGMANLDALLPATYALYVATPGGFGLQNGLELRGDRKLDLTLQTGGGLKVTVGQGEQNPRLGGALLSLTPSNMTEATRSLGSSADVNENIALLAAGGDARALVSRDGDGQIEVSDLPPGRYIARLRAPNYAIPEPRPVLIEPGQTATLDFALLPNAAPKAAELASLTLNLRVKGDDGAEKSAAAGDWALRILPIDQNGALVADTSNEGIFFPGGNATRRARSDENGQITLFPLQVGRYRVFVGPQAPIIEGSEPEAASLDTAVPSGGATATLLLPGAS